jgi:hypothetical protein
MKGKKMKEYRILVGKPEGKKPLVRPRWEDNIVICYLLTHRIIRGLQIVYLDLLDITSGEVYNHL